MKKKPTWWDNLVYSYFMRRWLPLFKSDVRLTALHFAEIESVRLQFKPTEDTTQYYEED
jgi:hypothetical protein